MVRIFVRHKVQDYAALRKGYDAFEPTRVRLAARGHAVYRDVDDGNDTPFGMTSATSRRPRRSQAPMN